MVHHYLQLYPQLSLTPTPSSTHTHRHILTHYHHQTNHSLHPSRLSIQSHRCYFSLVQAIDSILAADAGLSLVFYWLLKSASRPLTTVFLFASETDNAPSKAVNPLLRLGWPLALTRCEAQERNGRFKNQIKSNKWVIEEKAYRHSDNHPFSQRNCNISS